MTDKEATVYIVDVGRSMGQQHGDRTRNDLDWAMTYVWDKITSTVATERKTLYIGVVGLRTDSTANGLRADDGYSNITVWQELGQILQPDLRRLRQTIQISQTDQGDAISAIVVALQMMAKFTKKLRYKRKIVLVTDGRGTIDSDGMSDITSKVKEDNIELVVLGVDFDDEEYGYREENKDDVKAENEGVLKTFVRDCDGIIGTLAQAVDELGEPRVKVTRPVPSFKGILSLGDPEKYDSAMCVDVERYPRTMIRRPQAASQFVHRSDFSNGQAALAAASTQSTNTVVDGGEGTNQSNLTSVRNARTYQIEDEEAPGGKRDVPIEDLAKGYEYGRTAVPISESDQTVTRLETQAGLEIVGFIPWSNYDRCMSMSAANVIIAQRTNSKAAIAFSSLIHALYELESYAVARLVTKDDKPPLQVLLAPSIEPNYECLLEVQLPFAEDVRAHKFAPLDRVVTVSGKTLKEHRNLPTPDLYDAMSAYVDSMDLSTFGKDDDENPSEYMPLTNVYSPTLHRIDHAIRFRAVHPEAPIPPPNQILTRFSHPPPDLVTQSEHLIENLKKAADVKKVPPKLRSRRGGNRNAIAPRTNLNVTALLDAPDTSTNTSNPVPGNPSNAFPTIPADNAIPAFKQALNAPESVAAMHDAANQFGKIIEERIKSSFGDREYERCYEELGVLKEEMVEEMEEREWWDGFVQGLEEKVQSGELGEGRGEFVYGARRRKIFEQGKKREEEKGN